MAEISATKASRSFAELLDAVEHDGAESTLIRHGKAIARIQAVETSNGASVKEILRDWAPFPSFAHAIRSTRDLKETEERT